MSSNRLKRINRDIPAGLNTIAADATRLDITNTIVDLDERWNLPNENVIDSQESPPSIRKTPDATSPFWKRKDVTPRTAGRSNKRRAGGSVSSIEGRSFAISPSSTVKSQRLRGQSTYDHHGPQFVLDVDYDMEKPDDLSSKLVSPSVNHLANSMHRKLKRWRAQDDVDVFGPRHKRFKRTQPVELVESEDELSKEQTETAKKTFSAVLLKQKRQPSRGDIQPTQFSRPKSITSAFSRSRLIPDIHITQAVSGKHLLFPDDSREAPLVLRQAKAGSSLLRPEIATDGDDSLSWLQVDLERIRIVEHAITKSTLVHMTRPRSFEVESELWLKVEQKDDAVALVTTLPDEKALAIDVDELEKKWNRALTQAKLYRDTTPRNLSLAVPDAQPIFDGVKSDLFVHSGDPGASSSAKRQGRLVDQMRSVHEELTKATVKEDIEQFPSILPKRRTRNSAAAYVPAEISTLDRGWTSKNPGWEERWPSSLIYPATGKNRASVDQQDIERLDEGTFLNDNIIHFYIRFLQQQMMDNNPGLLGRVYIFSTFFFEKLRPTKGKINYEGVKAWTAKFDLLTYDYIVVPVNESGHWYLAIVCNAPNAIKSASPRIQSIERSLSDIAISDQGIETHPNDDKDSNKGLVDASLTESRVTSSGIQSSPSSLPPKQLDPFAPRIVTMDSLGAAHPLTIKSLKEYLAAEASNRRGIELTTAFRGVTAKGLPEQNNGCDCGVFMLGYLQNFLRDPDESSRRIAQREPLGWGLDPCQMRDQMRELLFDLQKGQQERMRMGKRRKKLKSIDESSTMSALPRDRSTPNSMGALPDNLEPLPGDIKPPPGRLVPPPDKLEKPEEPAGELATSPRAAIAGALTTPSEIHSPTGMIAENSETITSESRPLHQKPETLLTSLARSTIVTESESCIIHVPASTNSSSPTLHAVALDENRKKSSGAERTAEKTSVEGFIDIIPDSSSEQDVLLLSVTPSRRKPAATESGDVEEIMALSSAAKKGNHQNFDSSPTLIGQLCSSQTASSPTKPQAKYDGIARPFDLT